MADKIRHLGIVENIDGRCLKVRIVQTSACAACSVKEHCGVSGSEEKLIDVENTKGMECSVGQQVVIAVTSSQDMRAIVWAFLLPFIIVIASLFAAMFFSGGDEPFSALVALCMLVPYYIGLYMCRNRLKRTFVFTLES